MKRRTIAVFILLAICAGLAFAQAAAERSERIGIISAMSNEIQLLLDNAEIERVDNIGGVDFHVGKLKGKDVVIMKSGIGKVLASSAATTMLDHYNISEILFTGIAGGVGDETKVLDVVVATEIVQHDYGQVTSGGFVWELSESGICPCTPELVDLAYKAATETIGADNVFKGTIVTGDQFIASEWYVKELREKFNALACEMEGAAVAAVCLRYGTPFVIIRAMSDKADGLAHESMENMGDIAADHSSEIVMRMLQEM
ncbi:MAG: 5'-methylthioadenosine/adenosylhomocysteine nucleosidase [Spirochaetales bacterium]|nr:5'-methylthioadenosine/adenosylhomocysteine nucleosidase [Spirochaetales bacterium]